MRDIRFWILCLGYWIALIRNRLALDRLALGSGSDIGDRTSSVLEGPANVHSVRKVSRLSRLRRTAAVAAMALAGCATAAPVGYPPIEGAPPVPRPVTLWSFLGVDQMVGHHRLKHERTMAWLGQYFPQLEPKPPLLLNTSPAAAASPSIAVQNAAHVLAAEQQAPQKIKAIKAVAEVGAAAYPQVEEALLAGMDDRNAKVRLASVEAVLRTAGDPCEPCDISGNCTPAIRHRLWDLGYGVGPDGCPLEPSAPVRRVARLALDACGGPLPPECPPPQPMEFPAPEIIEQSLNAQGEFAPIVPAPQEGAASGGAALINPPAGGVPTPAGPALPGQ